MTRVRMRLRPPGAVLAVVTVGLVSTLGVGALPSVAGAATEGPAVITEVGSPTPLHSGGSAVPFGVALPSGASCPGDSAHDGYRVDSYLVPKGTSATDVNFATNIPSRGWGYFTTYGRYFGGVNTAEGTGAIVGIPPSFTWSHFTPGQLLPGGVPSATWEGGIACADVHGKVTDYWNTEITITADASDPGGFNWRVVHEGPLPGSTDTALWVGIGLLVVASLSAAYALSARRRDRSDGSTQAAPGEDVGADPSGDRRPAVPQHSG